MFSLRRCSQLFVLLIFTLKVDGTLGSQTCKKPPGVCVALPADDTSANYSHTADLIQQSVVSKTPNQTVAVGDDATFEIIVDLSDIDDTQSNLSIVSYVDGCELITGGKSPHCSFKKRNLKLFQTCTFRAVSSYDNGRYIQYWIFSGGHLLYVCQSASYLTVEADPQPIEAVDYSVNPCSGVSFTFSSPSVNDTNVHIECSIYYHNTNESAVLVYSSTDCTNDTLVPPEVFRDHSGNYSLVSQSVKTVAKGEKKMFSFTLGSNNLKLDIQKISIEFKDNNFYGEIFVKVNSSCMLVNPNDVYIRSNCSDHEQFEKIPENPSDDHLVLHDLQKEKRFCTFSFHTSAGGNTKQYQTDISTFILQEVTVTVLHDDPRYLMIVCRFVSAGSVIVGCTLNVTSESTSPLIYNITTNDVSSLVGVGVVGPLVPGTTYTIRVNDFVGEPDNTSGKLFTEIIQTIDPSASSKGSTSAVSPTTTNSVVPEIAATEPSNSNYNINVAASVGIAIAVVVVVLIIVALAIAVIVLIWQNKRQRYDVLYIHGTLRQDDESAKEDDGDVEEQSVAPVLPIEEKLPVTHPSTAETNNGASTLVFPTPHPPNLVTRPVTVHAPEQPVQRGPESPVYVPSSVPAGDNKTHRDSITQVYAPAEGVEQQQQTGNEKYVPPATQNDMTNASGSTTATNHGEDTPLLKKKKRH